MVHFLVDISSSMDGLAGPAGKESKLDLVKSMIVTNVCQRKLTSKTFEVAVTTYGDVSTNNHMQSEEGYKHINQIVKMDVPSQSFTQEVLSTIRPGRGVKDNNSTIAALMVTFDALIQAKPNYKYNRVMVFVTDGESMIVEDEADMEDVTSVITSMNDPNPKGETKVEPIPLYVVVAGKVTESSSRVKRENCKLLQSCATQTCGKYAEAESIEDMLWLLGQGIGLGPTPRKTAVELEVGSGLSIPCVYWNMVTHMPLPSIKKKLKVVDMAETEKQGQFSAAEGLPQSQLPPILAEPAVVGTSSTSTSSDYVTPFNGSAEDSSATAHVMIPKFQEEPATFTLMDVGRQTQYIRSTNGGGGRDGAPEEGVRVVVEEDTIEGYKYGEEYVTLSEANMEAAKIVGKSCVTLIGFMKAADMPRHHLLGSTAVIQGNDKVEQCVVAIGAFAQAMRNKGCVGIARAKLGRDSTADPYQVALVPPREDNGTLLMIQLPCQDDHRSYRFAPLPSFTPRSEQDGANKTRQLQAVSSLVDSMTVPVAAVGLKDLTPVNPAYYCAVQHIATQEGNCAKGDIPEVGNVFTARLQNKRLFTEAVGQVQAEFPLSKVHVKGSAGRREQTYFSDNWAEVPIPEEAYAAAKAGVKVDLEEKVRNKGGDDEMVELFVAVPLSEEARQAVMESSAEARATLAAAGDSEIQWEHILDLHVTVQNLQERKVGDLPALRERLQREISQVDSFRMWVQGAKSFAATKHGQCLYVGVNPESFGPLRALRDAVDRANGTTTATSSSESMTPYCTVVQTEGLRPNKQDPKRPNAAAQKFLSEGENLRSKPFLVESLTLYQSLRGLPRDEPVGEAPVYESLGTFKLKQLSSM